MSKGTSKAPKERINIVYTPSTDGQKSSVELPFKTLVLGHFSKSQEHLSVAERKPIKIDQNTFDNVLESLAPSAQFTVPNKLQENSSNEMFIDLEFKSLKDFSPDQIAKKVPELAKLIELRESLKALKGPTSNNPNFRKKLQEVLTQEKSRQQITAELKNKESN